MESNKNLKNRYDEIYKKGYSNHVSFDPSEESKVILDAIDDWRDLDVLEVGCGEGRLSSMMDLAGATVKGVDFSDEAVKIASERYPTVVFYQHDVLGGIYGKYDVVVMQGVLEHIKDPYSTLLELICDNLLPNGILITSSPGFLNPRGIVWMTIQKLFDVKMSLTDLHEIHPWDIGRFCEEHGYKLEITSSNYSWGNSVGCVKDFNKRFRSDTFPYKFDSEKVDGFLEWLDWALGCMEPSQFDTNNLRGGNIIYKITKGKR